jgi:nicotinamidase-related amidase
MEAKKMKEAVLVIDMLNDFVNGKLKCDRAQPIIPNIKRLNEAARQNGKDVIYVNDAHLPTDYELTLWGPHAMKGTPGAQVIEELEPKKTDYVIEKRTYSGFFETGLDSLLRDLNVEKVYLTGLHTHMCARHTAADAFFRKYKIVAVEDGLQAFTEKDHKDGLEYFPNYKAEVKTVDEIIKGWKG